MNKKYIVTRSDDHYFNKAGDLIKEIVLLNGDPYYYLLFPDGEQFGYFADEVELLWKPVK